jgi:DNA-binding transcriptional MerR regulator
MAEMLTIDQLVSRVAGALAVDYAGSASGRIRDLPDRRAIRYYATAGLVDRPTMHGRKAVYSRRHLLQVVAIKRLQAEGLPLAQIQAELAGADDDTLERIARLPRSTVEADVETLTRKLLGEREGSFWRSPVPIDARLTDGSTAAVPSPVATIDFQGIRLSDDPDVVLMWGGPPLTESDVQRLRSAAGPLRTVSAAIARRRPRGEP